METAPPSAPFAGFRSCEGRSPHGPMSRRFKDFRLVYECISGATAVVATRAAIWVIRIADRSALRNGIDGHVVDHNLIRRGSHQRSDLRIHPFHAFAARRRIVFRPIRTRGGSRRRMPEPATRWWSASANRAIMRCAPGRGQCYDPPGETEWRFAPEAPWRGLAQADGEYGH